MKIEIPDDALRETIQAALLSPPRYSHDEPPIRAISRAVVAAHARSIEEIIRECVQLILSSESFRDSLRDVVAHSLRDAVRARVHSVVGAITTREIRTLLAGVADSSAEAAAGDTPRRA